RSVGHDPGGAGSECRAGQLQGPAAREPVIRIIDGSVGFSRPFFRQSHVEFGNPSEYSQLHIGPRGVVQAEPGGIEQGWISVFKKILSAMVEKPTQGNLRRSEFRHGGSRRLAKSQRSEER